MARSAVAHDREPKYDGNCCIGYMFLAIAVLSSWVRAFLSTALDSWKAYFNVAQYTTTIVSCR